MRQHYRVVFTKDIYNMSILTELTVSLLFALCLSNYLSASSFIQDVLSVVKAFFFHSYMKNLKLESSRDTYSLSSAGRLLSPAVWRCESYEPMVEGDTVTPSLLRSGLSLCGKSSCLVTFWLMDGQVRTITHTEACICQSPQTCKITIHYSHYPLGPSLCGSF